MQSALKDKVFVVTGAGRGIGQATAVRLGALGARVALVSRTESELRDTQDKIPQGQAFGIPTDVTDQGQVMRAFEKVVKTWGRLDGVVANAGHFFASPVENFPVDAWEQVFATNVRGSFLCARAAFSYFKKVQKPGCLVFISSLGGLRGTEKFVGTSAYVASKFAVVGLTEALAAEGKPFGIRVNCVAPGAVNTRMLLEAAPQLKTETQPVDIAKTITFLCDESQSKALTGAVIEIFSNG